MSKTKQFRYLKPGDEVFVVDVDAIYKVNVVSVKLKMKDGDRYKTVDSLPDDISTKYGECKIEIELENPRVKYRSDYTNAPEEFDDWCEPDTVKICSYIANDDYYEFDEFYVFCSVEDVKRHRDWEYKSYVKQWDDIVERAEQL